MSLIAITWLIQSVIGGGSPLVGQSVVAGYVGGDARFFPTSPLAPAQPRWLSASVKVQPEVTVSLGEHFTLRSIAVARVDQSDSKRTYVDLREALIQWDSGPFTARVGMYTVFWGVTESRHLVNIVNQTDYLDDLDGDEKLGQLMGLLTYDDADVGLLDVFLMTRARAQIYPSGAGRPGVPIPVLDQSPLYESDHGEWNPDVAVRWSHGMGEVDWALSYFQGTGRDPQLILSGSVAEPTLWPRYDLIRQAGLELQWTHGDWLWKAESIARSGQGPTFAAVTAGFEHTTFGIFGSSVDLGAIAEYSYDGRDDQTFNMYDSDVFGGLRLSLNDVQGSEVLVGLLQDVESGVTLGSIEASRRLGEGWRLELVGRLFRADVDQDPVYWFRRDDYVQTVLEYHF